MKFIFLISAEHQLFQVENAISNFGILRNDVVLIIEKVSNNQNFIDKHLNSKLYPKVIIFESWTFIDILKNPYKYQNFINLCLSFSKYDITFFASHYDTDSPLLFNSIVKPDKYFLMDEGTASFTVQMQRNTFELISKIKFFIKSIFYRTRIRLPLTLTYFTKFYLSLSKNDYIEIYKVEKNNNALTSLIRNELIFIGSSIVELKMMDKVDYIRYLSKIISDSSCEITNFHYYPHRNESENKLSEIAKLGFKIFHLDEPFETFFRSQVKIAGTICSFFTTNVIFNIATSNIILPKLVIYKFDTNLLKRDRQVYENIYENIKTNKKINFLML